MRNIRWYRSNVYGVWVELRSKIGLMRKVYVIFDHDFNTILIRVFDIYSSINFDVVDLLFGDTPIDLWVVLNIFEEAVRFFFYIENPGLFGFKLSFWQIFIFEPLIMTLLLEEWLIGLIIPLFFILIVYLACLSVINIRRLGIDEGSKWHEFIKINWWYDRLCIIFLKFPWFGMTSRTISFFRGTKMIFLLKVRIHFWFYFYI